MRRAVLVPLLVASVLAGPPTLVSNGAICENKATGFFVMDNMELDSTDSITYKDYSEDDCLKTCSQNRDQLGRSILCASFVYHHETFTCTIYKEKKIPEGKSERKLSIGKRYFEKICLNEDVPIHCADAQFLRVDNFELVGYAVAVEVTDSLEGCLGTCAKNSTCKSALYFYEEKECIMNTESALSKPDDFKKSQDDDKVIYFQNACAAPRVQIEPTTPAPDVTHKASSEREGSADLSSSEKTTVEVEEEEEEETTAPTTAAPITEEPVHEEEENDHEADHELEKVEGEHEASSPKETEEGEYEDEEEDEEEVRKEKDRNDKLAQEKASYIKYKQHPKNFASRTLKATDDEPVVEAEDEHTASHEEETEENVEQISKEEADEPVESRTKLTKKSKKTKPGKKELKEESASELVEESFTNYFSEWSDWTPCTKSGERQIRRRKCLDLRKCLGALMQVRNCPAIIPTEAPESIESIRSLVAVPPVDYDDTVIRSPVSVVRSHPDAPLRQPGQPLPEAVWSPWQGTCQQFASGQPCNDGQMIGFESRECVAKDPSFCEGPFFRYCTLPC